MKSTPQELGMLKRERSERFYFLVHHKNIIRFSEVFIDFDSFALSFVLLLFEKNAETKVIASWFPQNPF